MCIELEPLGIERVYIAGEDNILGDAPSRASADREVARNLAVPLAPIKEIIHRMFWAPDELAGDTRERLKQLHIDNPGVLSYVPDQLLADADLVNEARPEDELAEPERAFSPCEQEETSHVVGQMGVRSYVGAPGSTGVGLNFPPCRGQQQSWNGEEAHRGTGYKPYGSTG